MAGGCLCGICGSCGLRLALKNLIVLQQIKNASVESDAKRSQKSMQQNFKLI